MSSVLAGGINKMMGFCMSRLMSRLMPRHAAVSMFGSMMAKAMNPAMR